MMQQVLKWAVPIAFIGHGLGMLGGLYFVFTTRSWFEAALGGSVVAARLLTALIWVVAGVAFVAAGWGYWHDLDWWRTAAWVGAPASLAGIALWAGPIPAGTYVGGIMSLAVIVALALGW